MTHPVQYHVPWFRHLARRYDLTVFYGHRQNSDGQAASGFGVPFEWDVPLYGGYEHRWLTNVARRPTVRSYAGCDTPEIGSIIARERFDGFVLFGWNRKCYLQAAAACWRRGVPVLARGDSQLQTPRSLLTRVVKRIPYRCFLPRFDGHLYVGTRNKQYLRHYGVPSDRLFFAPHFVDSEYFASRVRMAIDARAHVHLRASLGIRPGAFVVLYAGKFLPIKRPMDVVQASRLLDQSLERQDIHVVFVGDGPLREELARAGSQHPGRIHFAGFQNQGRMPVYYAAANALVVPGAETWGLVVNEAMACGLPAVVSDAAGCAPDMIDDGKTGYRYPAGDVKQLAACISVLPGLCRNSPAAVAEAVRDKVATHSIETASHGLRLALERVADGRRPYGDVSLPSPVVRAPRSRRQMAEKN